MRTHYFAFYHKADSHEVACVQSGFSMLAFLFGPLWLLYHRLWWPLLATSLVTVLGQLAVADYPDAQFYLSLLVNIVIAASGDYWREKKLQSRGLRFACSVPARNKSEAQWRFMQLPV